MRRSLNILADELKRLKSDGVRSVSVNPESLKKLNSLVQSYQDQAVGSTREESAKEKTPQPEGKTRTGESDDKPQAGSLPPAPEITLPEGSKSVRWEALKELVLSDPTCLTQVRPGKRVVFGVGNVDAKIMFVGEAPGAEEEKQGEPFVGPAGQLLTKMIAGMGLAREDVYIGNIMNWRPQMPVGANGEQYGNRPPNTDEMAYCLPFLRAQIEIIAPQVIVALGATAAHGLLGPDAFGALGEVRGTWQEFAGRPLMVTYHPSYILRNQSNRSKRMIWEDLLKVMERCELPISDKQRGYFSER